MAQPPETRPKVCITLPAYRAESTLAKTIADIPPGVADELILVDDHSPDNTAQLARDLGIDVYMHPENRQYGGNQKTCYSVALLHGADIVVLLHPDYQYDPKAVPLLIAPILSGHADMTFGSRFAATGNPLAGGMPLYRFLGNRAATILENLFIGSRFTEMHSGLRAYTRRSLLALPFLSYSDAFVFDSQLLVDAVTTRMRVVEVPIMTRYTHESSSAPVGASIRYVLQSVGYAVRRGRERGRRGKKAPWSASRSVPTASSTRLDEPARTAVPVHGPAASPNDRRRLEFLIGAASGYWSPGRRMAIFGSSDAAVAGIASKYGWEVPEDPAVGAADNDVAVMVDRLGDSSEVFAWLSSAVPRLSQEGLLVMTGPESLTPMTGWRSSGEPIGRTLSATVVNDLLRGAGFRPVEWKRLPESCGPGVLIIARRD